MMRSPDSLKVWGGAEIEVFAALVNIPVVHVLKSNHFLLCIYDQLFAAHDDDDDCEQQATESLGALDLNLCTCWCQKLVVNTRI